MFLSWHFLGLIFFMNRVDGAENSIFFRITKEKFTNFNTTTAKKFQIILTGFN